METNGYIYITADSYEEAATAASEFEIKAGLTVEARTLDYNTALQVSAEITNDQSSAKVEFGLDSGPFFVDLSADTKGRYSIMTGFRVEF